MQPLTTREQVYQDEAHKSDKTSFVTFCVCIVLFFALCGSLGSYVVRVSESTLVRPTCASLALYGVSYEGVLVAWADNPRLDADGKNGPCTVQYGKHPGVVWSPRI